MTDSTVDGPLAGVTVVELGNIVAGPFASVMLADMGADVVKVERPGVGDIIRETGDSGPPMFDALNRNKRSVELDLKSDAGREAFLALAAEADVVVENLGPGVTDRLEIGYDDLAARNPGLVYLSIKGFLEGPYGDRAGMDVVAEAMSGLMSMTGEPGRTPLRVGTSIADMGAAMYGVMGVLLALWERERTGEGCRVDGPLFEAAASWMGYWVTYADRYGRDHPPLGASHPSWALYDVFPVGTEREDGDEDRVGDEEGDEDGTGDADWLFVGVTTERHWPAFCRAVGMEELLADERFESGRARMDNQDALTALVREELRGRDPEAVLESLLAEDVPAAPVNDPSDLLDDDHLDAVGMLARFESAFGSDPTQTVMTPIHGDGMAPSQRLDPPGLGEHTEAVMREYGFDPADVDRLREAGAFGDD